MKRPKGWSGVGNGTRGPPLVYQLWEDLLKSPEAGLNAQLGGRRHGPSPLLQGAVQRPQKATLSHLQWGDPFPFQTSLLPTPTPRKISRHRGCQIVKEMRLSEHRLGRQKADKF